VKIRSLGSRLLLLFVSLVGAALLASTIAALTAANANVRALLREDLEVRSRIASLALERQGEALRERVAVVTADFGFKAAAATQERDTILSALANHGERLDADLAMWLNPAGDIVLSSAPVQTLPPSLGKLISSGTPRAAATLEAVAATPYLLAVSPVLAPALTGWLVIGVALDASALDELSQLAGAAITLANGAGGSATLLRSTLPDLDVNADTAAALEERPGWLDTSLPLGRGDALTLHVSVSVDDALEDFDPLRAQLVAIAVAALVLAAVLAFLASRWLTRPIRAMVGNARQIADGDYTQKTDVRTGTELDTLSEALSFMQSTVAEREARIQYQAQHDLLTQLPNRNYMYSLYRRFLRDNPQRADFAIALIELENLTQLRDLYGSAFCDVVLREASRRISDSLRRGDIAGRVADQQILLFLQGLRSEGLAGLLQKVDELTAAPFDVEGIPVRAELRFGFAFSPAHGVDFDDLQRRAQLALSDARQRGERHGVYTIGQDERHLRQIRIANRLRPAIAEGAFHLQYQPKYDLRSLRVTGAEALLRWQDRELGTVYPDEFILVAEQTGIVTELSAWVLEQVLEDQRAWRSAGLSISASVNLSGVDVLNGEFVDGVVERIGAAGLPVDAVVLEVTETAMMADVELARSNMQRLERLGMRISIDDYGTGFSSLAQLRTLPVRELKLDRSLVATIADEEGDRLIVQSTIDMAHHLGLEVVAEGVEGGAVLRSLAAMGCDLLQGYLLARPMSALALTAYLSREPGTTAHIAAELETARARRA
jgi:diguanylate cyclase (GGDEF)-like protein